MDKELDTKWFQAYSDLCQAVVDFVLERVESIGVWRGKQAADGAEAYFNSIADACMSGQAPSGGSSVAAPVKAVVSSSSSGSLVGAYQKEVVCHVKAWQDATAALNIA